MRKKDIRPEKKQLVHDLVGLIGSSETLFLVSYKGLKVEEFSAFRDDLASLQSECHVIPNRLFMRAAAESGLDGVIDPPLAGDSALITGGTDAAAVAKAVRKFGSSHQALQVKLGTVGGQFLSAGDVDMMANLPGREILLAQLLGVMQAPARNAAGVLYNRLASIVYALDEYHNSRS